MQVFNGSGAPGLATIAAGALAHEGFAINGTANAASYKYQASVIEYPPGSLALAETLAQHVSGSTMLEISSAVPPDEVWLILGSTYKGAT